MEFDFGPMILNGVLIVFDEMCFSCGWIYCWFVTMSVELMMLYVLNEIGHFLKTIFVYSFSIVRQPNKPSWIAYSYSILNNMT